MQTRLIIFDFDGTLGDTRRNIVTTMQMTIGELMLEPRSEADCAATIGLPLDGCFRALFPEAPSTLIERCTETYRRIFEENLKTIKPQTFPGVTETLTTLKQRGFTLTIASSRWHRSLDELTRDLGLSPFIAYLVGANDVQQAKPHPEPVLKTLEALHFSAEETLVVGDMPVDILMGANAGAKTCGVSWGNATREELLQAGADHIIDTMDELLAVCSPDAQEQPAGI